VKVNGAGDHIKAVEASLKQNSQEFLISFVGKLPRRADQYEIIKKYTLSTGLISQVIDCDQNSKNWEKKIGKDSGNIQFNIIKQIINKMGEFCWTTRIETSAPWLKNKSVIIIGVDVYHDKKVFEEQKKRYRQRRSIGGFVGVVITKDGKFHTSCAINPHEARAEIMGEHRKPKGPSPEMDPTKEFAPEEVLDRPEGCEDNALSKFILRIVSEHKVTPDHIIIYRDGVGGSQFDAVRDYEVQQVTSALPRVSMTYLVIQKGIHTRFFIEGPQGVASPPPGTIYYGDLSLYIENYENFFLIPTTCNLSTVKPVHYILIRNDGLPVRELQQLTYCFCHLYPNWTNSIKLPFPTQAAHKLSYLVGDLKIDKPVLHAHLHRSLFYL
jgi:aubergine-like protein